MIYDEKTGTLKKVEMADVDDGTVKLPSGVKIIASNAFYELHSLKRVVLPATVTEVHEDAFHNCRCLEEIIFNQTNTQVKMQKFAFFTLHSLRRLTLPYFEVVTKTSILFASCPKLEDITLLSPNRCLCSYNFGFDEGKTLILPESIEDVDWVDTTSVRRFRIAVDTQNEEELLRIKNLFPEKTQNRIFRLDHLHTIQSTFCLNVLLGIAAVSGAALCVTAIMVFSLPLSLMVAAAGVACAVAASIGLFAINRKQGSQEHQEISTPTFQTA